MPFFGIENRTVYVPRNMISLSPKGGCVFFLPERNKFYEYKDGIAREYHDTDIGLVNYKGRKYIKSGATSFIRDGVHYTVHIPSEHKIIERPAMADDSAFREYDFSASGIWADDFTEIHQIFGESERVAKSVDLHGSPLLTRRNGEVMVIGQDGYEPYVPPDLHTSSSVVRIDLARNNEGKNELVTVFFSLRSSLGARKWLEHFSAAQSYCEAASPYGSSFLRNWNVIFSNGSADLEAAVTALARTVSTINESYTSTVATSNSGKLHVPTLDNVSFQLLNQLHFEFEQFGDRLKSGASTEQAAIRGVFGPFCQLNDQIHACEGAISNRHRNLEEAWWAIHCAFLPDFYEPLPDEIYPEFELDWNFGTLYMGYHTLGKDMLASFWNQDIELFERDEIRPQRISSSEIYVFLGPDSRGQRDAMQSWWHSNQLDKYGYKFDDPRNSIGYIPIGDIVCGKLGQLAIKTTLKDCKKLINVGVISV